MAIARSVTLFVAPVVALVATVYACSACGGGNAAPPADAPPDVSNGSCGSMLRFTGEYIDWDSSDSAFCGIFGPTFTVEGTGMRTTTNAPNGRFDLCVPDQAVSLVDIAPPAMPSQCATIASGEIYTMPAIAVANRAEITAGGAWSGRAFGMMESTVPSPDPTKAQVFVHVNGTPTQVSISTMAHGSPQARVSDAWTDSDTGTDVYFPNVDPTGGMTTLSAAGAIGTGPIPLVAGKMTNVSIVVN